MTLPQPCKVQQCAACGAVVRIYRTTDHGSAKIEEHGHPRCNESGRNPWRAEYRIRRVCAFLGINHRKVSMPKPKPHKQVELRGGL